MHGKTAFNETVQYFNETIFIASDFNKQNESFIFIQNLKCFENY